MVVALGQNDTGFELREPLWGLLQSIIKPVGPKRVRQIVVEGSRGTGKSRGLLQIIAHIVETIPNVSGVICRNTRESMTGSTLQLWNECWPADHPILKGAAPEQRSVYRHPDTKSQVFVLGMNEMERWRSRNDDFVYFEEASEGNLKIWESFFGVCRHWAMHDMLIMGSTNPKHPAHYLNKLCIDGKAERIRTTLKCNPKYAWPDGRLKPEGQAYQDMLEKLTGPAYKRDCLGLWFASEGAIFDEYDESLHVVEVEGIEKKGSAHLIHVKGWAKPFDVDNYFVSMDFGYRAAGVLQIWAEDPKGRLLRVAEVYQPDKQLDWWADRLLELHDKYPFADGVGDSAEPRTIDFLNDRLRWLRSGDVFIRPAEKTRGKLFGIDQMHWGLSRKDGGPRTFLAKDAFPFGKSAKLSEQSHMTCLEDELPAYVWDNFEDPKDGQEKKERPDRGCDDHAIDAAIYAHVYAWKRRMRSGVDRNTIFQQGTIGHHLRDYEILGWDYNPAKKGKVATL